MNQYLIKKYIDKLSKEDIRNYTLNENIKLTEKEIDIIYYYIKNKYNLLFNGCSQQLLLELKEKLSNNTYQIIEELYYKYKDYI